jgi:c-di-GMP-binding flagellar brake protein YcgR
MTPLQQSTVNRLTKMVERANGKQNVTVFDISKGHIIISIGNKRETTYATTKTTYVDVEVNTKGNITKGFVDTLRPKVKTTY